jgi:hypothetical protein
MQYPTMACLDASFYTVVCALLCIFEKFIDTCLKDKFQPSLGLNYLDWLVSLAGLELVLQGFVFVKAVVADKGYNLG